MARHARTPMVVAGLGRAVERLRTWASRTEQTLAGRLTPARNGATLGPRVLREVAVLLAVLTAGLTAFGVLFALAAHPLRPRGPQPQVVARAGSDVRAAPGSAADAASNGADAAPGRPNAAVSSAASSAAASSNLGAAVTPPPVPVRPSLTAAATPPANSSAATATPPAKSSATAAAQTSAGTAGDVGPIVSTAPAAPPPLQPPVPGAVLQGFGWAYSAIFGDWQQHTGLDLAVTPGDRVLSPGAGVVAAVRQDGLWGWVVSIALDHGYSTNLSPLARVDVQVGQAVRAGTPLGVAAASAPAEADLPPHVFWQVFQGTRPIDPAVG